MTGPSCASSPRRPAIRKPSLARPGPHTHDHAAEPDRERPPAWHGTILPATDADTWLAAAFADYERVVSLEQSLEAKAQGRQAFE